MRYLLRYIIISIMLAACSPAEPLRLPASVVTSAATNQSPLPTHVAILESAAPESPLQTATTETLASPPITRIAVVDQSSAVDVSRAGWWSIKALAPVGQTFRPSFAGLDTIALWTEDQWDAVCSGAGAGLQVNLREAAIDGPVMGSSALVVVPDCFKGLTHFGFPALIPLTPDKAYVIEVVIISGDNWGVVWQQVPDSYSRGDAIVLGTSSNADIRFQEGLRNSTPLTGAYCQDNLWQHVKRADGSAFRNQGDCIQYVNTRQ